MKNSYDSLNDAFNTDPVESTEIVKEQKRKEQIQKLTDDVSKDCLLYTSPSPRD